MQRGKSKLHHSNFVVKNPQMSTCPNSTVGSAGAVQKQKALNKKNLHSYPWNTSAGNRNASFSLVLIKVTPLLPRHFKNTKNPEMFLGNLFSWYKLTPSTEVVLDRWLHISWGVKLPCLLFLPLVANPSMPNSSLAAVPEQHQSGNFPISYIISVPYKTLVNPE